MAETGGINFSLESDDFLRQLNQLSEDIEKRVGDKAIAAGGREYRKLVRAQIPLGGRKRRATDLKVNADDSLQRYKSGRVKVNKDTEDLHLKNSIAVRKAKNSKKRGIIQYRVGIVGWARAYAHVYEFGSKYHSGNKVFTRTFESQFNRIINKIADVMRKEIAKHGRS